MLKKQKKVGGKKCVKFTDGKIEQSKNKKKITQFALNSVQNKLINFDFRDLG